MKKTLIFLFVVLLSFTSCDTGNSGTSSTAGAPRAVSITDADGLFIQTSGSAALSPSKSGRLLAPGVGDSTLMKAVGSETYQATFTDAQGQAVTVDVDYSRKLNSDYIYIQYSYEDESYYCVASYDTGILKEIKSPDTRDNMREYSGNLYYISGGVLYKMDLATLDYTARSSSGDGLSSNSLVFVSPSTDNVFLFAQNNHRCYFSGGTTYQDNSTNTNCELFYLTLNGEYPSRHIVEDRGTSEIYYIYFEASEISAFQMEFDQPGYIGTVMPGSEFTVSSTAPGYCGKLSGKTVYFDNTVFCSNETTESVIRLTYNSTENISATFYTSSAEVMLNGNPLDGKFDIDSKKLITSYNTGGQYKINDRDLSGGSMSESTLVSTASEITACCITGGNVYYCADGQTYCYNFSNGTSELYVPEAVEVEAVTE